MLNLNLDGFVTGLDGLLRPICQKLQLSKSRHQEAEGRYKAVGDWIDRPGSALRQFHPRIYPQGSLAIGATVKPLIQQEFDLDFVLELQMSLSIFDNNPILLLDMLENCLREHGTYTAMLERKNRCIRLVYANRFHMDILPAVPADYGLEGCLKVPDRQAQNWKDSNPLGFVRWFASRSNFTKTDARQQVSLPSHETLDAKTTLQCAVQLIKRWRDIYFLETQKEAPVSIVLTTLAGQHYNGEDSVEQAVTGILDGILMDIRSCGSGKRLIVLNPANPEEDLSERWNDVHVYRAFIESIKRFQSDWQALCSTSGIDNICTVLKGLFGEQPTTEVLAERSQLLAQNRAAGKIAVTSSGSNQGIIVPAGAGTIAVRPHTFYGSSD